MIYKETYNLRDMHATTILRHKKSHKQRETEFVGRPVARIFHHKSMSKTSLFADKAGFRIIVSW